MSLRRIHRLIQLLGLLQAGKGYNVEALALACGVHRRTIFRDLDTLRQCGLQVVFDEEAQVYRVPGTHYLPATNFTPEEALSLIVLCHEMGDAANLPFFGPARSAAVKLEASLPARLREHLQSMAGTVNIRTMPRSDLAGQETVYDQLIEAIRGRRAVRIRYRSFTEWEEICTRLSPYRLLFSRRSWYVIGRSSLHRAARTFNVGRITDIEVLDDEYRIPRGFSLERYLGNAWHLIPESGPDQDVVVRFSKLVAQNVAEVVWHKTQRLVINDDGSLDFHVTVSGLGEISWWILGYGDQAEVLRPAKLRSRIAERAEKAAAQYRS
jgi:predicted DNA-binding transcriptional regulator YafY